jgi:hypothetical protein
MSKLFLFAIGGTGSRVTKALTMLLASGVTLPNTSEVIPIIVDPHSTNSDLLRTVELMKHYQAIRNSLTTKPTQGFFSTEIKTLKQAIPKANLSDTYLYELQGVQEEKFRDYIDFNGLERTDPANGALASLLFTEENLETKMDIGFVGNPNIGSTVLNQFQHSDVFKAFAEHFAEGDRVFIVSSIFGGTGAAGFPILLKNIRNAEAGKLDNQAFLKKAKIGAVTVMPYFKITTNDQKRVDSNTFIAKTKAALNYYARNVNQSVNALYYLGDDQTKSYAYDPGSNGQRNDAHLIELVAALAIVDFMGMTDDQLNNPVGKDFGIKTDATDLHLTHLADQTQKLIGLPMAKMALFSSYLNQRLVETAGNVAWAVQAPELSSRFLQSDFMQKVNSFDAGFRDWLAEMGQNKRGFAPFITNSTVLNKLIRGYEPTKRNLFGKEQDVVLEFKNDYDALLNKTIAGKTYTSEADKFIGLFSETTEQFVKTHFPNLPK